MASSVSLALHADRGLVAEPNRAGLLRREDELVHHCFAVAREILHQTQRVQGVTVRAAMQVHAKVWFFRITGGQRLERCQVFCFQPGFELVRRENWRKVELLALRTPLLAPFAERTALDERHRDQDPESQQ